MDFKKDVKYDFLGIGNAMVDYFKTVDGNFLKNCELEEGGAHYPGKLICSLEGLPRSAGGTTANVINNLALLGCKTGFHGVIGNDDTGRFFRESFDKDVDLFLLEKEGESAYLIALITGGERTFVVDYGVAMQFEKDKLPTDAIKDSKVLHTSLYKFEHAESRENIFEAMVVAKKNDTKISLDLAAYTLLKDLKSKFDLCRLLKEYIDIVFANEDEANELGCKLENLCEITVYKKGADGSVVIENNKRNKHMISMSSSGYKSNVINTSGAGDAFAAGFLYSLINGKGLYRASKLANYLAHKVVEKVNSRLDAEDISDVEKFLRGC